MLIGLVVTCGIAAVLVLIGAFFYCSFKLLKITWPFQAAQWALEISKCEHQLDYYYECGKMSPDPKKEFHPTYFASGDGTDEWMAREKARLWNYLATAKPKPFAKEEDISVQRREKWEKHGGHPPHGYQPQVSPEVQAKRKQAAQDQL